MRRDDLADLSLFQAVAEVRSFSRAAGRLGLSQSGLSQTIKRLEDRLGFRLLARTTRSVRPTEEGQQLLATLQPALGDIDACLAGIRLRQERIAGTVRLTLTRVELESFVWPAIDRVLRDYPDIQVELSVDAGFVDIVAGGFDAGIRLGEHLEKNMVAVRIGPPMELAVVGAPDYFARHPPPREPRDLTAHQCINFRLGSGALYAWEFEKAGRPLNVRVTGPLILNDLATAIRAAIGGHGLLCSFANQVEPWLASGALVRVLDDWCPPFDGYYIYYPHRRQVSPALSVVIEQLKRSFVPG